MEELLKNHSQELDRSMIQNAPKIMESFLKEYSIAYVYQQLNDIIYNYSQAFIGSEGGVCTKEECSRNLYFLRTLRDVFCDPKNLIQY